MTVMTPETVARLRELEGKATSEPWTDDGLGHIENINAVVQVATVPMGWDLTLITLLRNHASELIEAAEKGLTIESAIPASLIGTAMESARLRAEVSRLEEERDELRSVLEEVEDALSELGVATRNEAELVGEHLEEETGNPEWVGLLVRIRAALSRRAPSGAEG